MVQFFGVKPGLRAKRIHFLQGLHELKQHKPWFDEECLGFLD